ncbi:MAG: GGDEF domain-containing protein [Synergistaceae bacterium]|nr:GGDEF domain-containing protein [Synergistaceae bacterium]
MEQEYLAAVDEILFKYLRDIVCAPSKARLDVEQLPRELRRFGYGLKFFAECATETANFLEALSRGDTRGPAAPPKPPNSAQNLLMGDFAAMCDVMAQQLKERKKALIVEIESGRRKAQALESSNSLFEAITSNMTQLIVVADRETREWLFLNHQVENLLAERRFRPQLFNWINSQLDEMKQDTQPYSAEAEFLEDDVIQCFSVGCYPLHWHGRNAAAFVLADITDEKKRMKLLEDYAYRDTLTKTYNRHWGMEILDTWIAEKRRFLICFVDIDYLKYVNDEFGHSAGDAYILCVVDSLRNFSKDALISRLGGDEFMVLDEKHDIESAKARLEEIRSELREQQATADALCPYSISYGIVEVDRDNTLPAGDLLAMADEKMYKYKRSHKIARAGAAPV